MKIPTSKTVADVQAEVLADAETFVLAHVGLVASDLCDIGCAYLYNLPCSISSNDELIEDFLDTIKNKYNV